MARVVVTSPADQDIADILTTIAREAGYAAAGKYNLRLEALYGRLIHHPEAARSSHGLAHRYGLA